MDTFRKKTETHYKIACLFLGWIGFWVFFMPAQGFCENSVADAIVSLNAADQELGEVLKNISIDANCRFIFDKGWEDYPITAIFDDEPLYRALKLIFRDINNAIIYGEDRTIRIIIYDEGRSSDETIGHSASIKPSEESILQAPNIGAATAPQSETEFLETDSHKEDVEQLPETADETGSEAQDSEAENTDADDEEPGETEDEETGANLQAEEKENQSDAQSD